MGKVQVRKANINDAENIVDLLEGFYPGVPGHWRKIFAPRPWQTQEDFPGFVLDDDGKIVGFLGTIFSDHETAKGPLKICNFTSWYIDPNYRQHGLLLFMKAMKLDGVVWTNLSAAPHTYDFLKRAGFKALTDVKTYILPIPRIRKIKHISLQLDITAKDLDDEKLQQIYNKHQGLYCKHVLIKNGTESCYCLIVTTRYKKLPLAKIYFISNPVLFKKVIKDVCLSLCLKLQVCYLMVEGDLLKETKITGSWRRPIFPPRLYKSDKFEKEEIPILCSEFFILGI